MPTIPGEGPTTPGCASDTSTPDHRNLDRDGPGQAAPQDGLPVLAETVRTRQQDPQPAAQLRPGDHRRRNPPEEGRFLKTTGQATSFDQSAYDKAVSLAGLKGYVTNIPPNQMAGAQVIAAYHDLWRVEQSFRMSKSDLDARPIFHHTRDAIEAHLDIVFAALAIARYIQDQSGWSIKRLVRTLRPLREVTINIAGHELIAEPTIDPNTQKIIIKILGH